MGKRLQVREVGSEQRQALARLAHSRSEPAGRVQRAQVVLAALEGMAVEEIAVREHLARNTVYLWLHRFEDHGLAGLKDAARNGRPPTYTTEQVSEIVATALTDPQTLGLPFHSWCPGYCADLVAKNRICEDLRVCMSCSFLPGRWSAPRLSDCYGSLKLASE
jgi:hypothetical protein